MVVITPTMPNRIEGRTRDGSTAPHTALRPRSGCKCVFLVTTLPTAAGQTCVPRNDKHGYTAKLRITIRPDVICRSHSVAVYSRQAAVSLQGVALSQSVASLNKNRHQFD